MQHSEAYDTPSRLLHDSDSPGRMHQPSMPSDSPETRLCDVCYRRLPVTSFLWRSRRRGRERQCKDCHRDYEKGRRDRKKLRETDQAVSQFVLRVNRAPRGQKVAALVNEMVQHFGGLEKFTIAWKAQVDRVRQSQPMGKKVLDFFRAVTRMAEVSEEHEPDARELSDSDLADQLLASAERLVSDHPELVLHVAESLGWTVVPPGAEAARQSRLSSLL